MNAPLCIKPAHNSVAWGFNDYIDWLYSILILVVGFFSSQYDFIIGCKAVEGLGTISEPLLIKNSGFKLILDGLVIEKSIVDDEEDDQDTNPPKNRKPNRRQ